MPYMSHHSDPPPPSDVCLLLRAHAEQQWLSREVVPVLRQLQQRDSLPEEQLGAALAYLEVIWIEASRRAAETDATFAELEAACAASRQTLASEDATYTPEATLHDGAKALPDKARHYHAAVRTLRDAIARNVAPLLAVPSNGAAARQHANS
jgi:hypothetical protein